MSQTLAAERLAVFTSYGRGAGSARVRVFDWLDHLGLEGSNASTYLGASSNSPRVLAQQSLRIPLAELRLRNLVRSIEGGTALLSRQASPFSNGAIERTILSRAERGVYDFDDALMHSPSRLVERVWSKRNIWRRSVESADVVIAGNEYLAAEAAQYNKNVTLIPSCVEPDSYIVKLDYETAEAPLAVWLGSPGTEQYLLGLAEPLLALHESRGLRLMVISAGNASLGALDSMVDRRSWSAGTYQRQLVQADLGLMPLEDNAWTRGKCAYKLLQYGAAGLPMVGSNVGVNKTVLELTDGIAVSTREEWREAIDSLITESASRRAERGRTARAAIDEKYSFRAWADAWRGAVGLAPA